jgi:hypothetical protein
MISTMNGGVAVPIRVAARTGSGIRRLVAVSSSIWAHKHAKTDAGIRSASYLLHMPVLNSLPCHRCTPLPCQCDGARVKIKK